jgi:hypothetical protein
MPPAKYQPAFNMAHIIKFGVYITGCKAIRSPSCQFAVNFAYIKDD